MIPYCYFIKNGITPTLPPKDNFYKKCFLLQEKIQGEHYRINYLNGDFFGAFDLYMGLENLYAVFSDESFLLIFWLHFLAISLFAGAWIVRDSKKYFIPKVVTIPSLILTYLFAV